MLPVAISHEVSDLAFPQREAAFFYGLFLRGHSADELRRDIEVPPAVVAKWESRRRAPAEACANFSIV